MKKNDVQKLRELSLDELKKKLEGLLVEKEQARIKRSVGKLENTAIVKTLGKDIAVIKTIITEKSKQ